MKTTLNESQFIDAFKRSSERKEQFSYEALKALFEHLEQLEQDTGSEIEFDMIALCCEYQEIESVEEFNNQYKSDYESIDDIRDQTTVIPFGNDGAFIFQQF